MDILLSANDVENPERNIVNSHGLFNSGGVLYISLDGLSDPATARDLSQLITSDIAAEAGSRYNTASDLSTVPGVSIFIDEAHQAVNMQLINLLARDARPRSHCSSLRRPFLILYRPPAPILLTV